MQAGFEIREAAPADLSTVEALDRLSVEERSISQLALPRPGISLIDLVRSNGHRDARCLVAVDSDTQAILGFAFLDVEQVTWNGSRVEAGYLFHIRVHPSHRRRGIATGLSAHRENLARDEGSQLTWGAVVQGNRASRAYVHRRGYSFGSRVEYKAVPLLLPTAWLPGSGRGTTVRPAAREDDLEIEELQRSFWSRHQLWAPRRYSLASQEYVAQDSGGRIVACTVCFEQYRVAEVRNLGMKGLPRLVNRLLAPLASRVASRYVFVRDLAFVDAEAAFDLLAWLAARYRGEADFLVVGADTRSEAQRAIRRLPGLSGWVDVLVKTNGLAIDASRPYHMVLG